MNCQTSMICRRHHMIKYLPCYSYYILSSKTTCQLLVLVIYRYTAIRHSSSHFLNPWMINELAFLQCGCSLTSIVYYHPSINKRPFLHKSSSDVKKKTAAIILHHKKCSTTHMQPACSSTKEGEYINTHKNCYFYYVLNLLPVLHCTRHSPAQIWWEGEARN